MDYTNMSFQHMLANVDVLCVGRWQFNITLPEFGFESPRVNVVTKVFLCKTDRYLYE